MLLKPSVYERLRYKLRQCPFYGLRLEKPLIDYQKAVDKHDATMLKLEETCEARPRSVACKRLAAYQAECDASCAKYF